MTVGTITKPGRHGKLITHIKDFAPRYIACFVSKKALREGVQDAWTVVFTKYSIWQLPRTVKENPYIGRVYYVGMSQNGNYYHGEGEKSSFYAGTRIKFSDLTPGQRRTVIEEYEACWGIKMRCADGYIPVDWEVAL